MAGGFASLLSGAKRRRSKKSRRPMPETRSRSVAAVPAVLSGPVGDDDLECRARAGRLYEADRAAVGANDLGGDRKPEAGAARPGAALKGLEQMIAGAFRHARTGVADADGDIAAVAGAADRQPAHHRRALVAALERLDGVATEIDEDAEELVGIGVDLQPGRDLVLEGYGRVADKAEGIGDVVDHAVERHQPPFGRRLAGAAIGERR